MLSNFPLALSVPLAALILGWVLSFSAFPALADKLSDAQLLMKQGQSAQALAAVDAHLASKPSEAQGRFLKGLILSEMGRPAEAIAVFGKLAEDYPELPEPYNNLAVLYAGQKQYDKARTALEMAIRILPGYTIAYENLGDVYARLASQAYDKALQLDPSKKTAQSKLARLRELNATSGIAGKPESAMRSTGEPARMASAEPRGATAAPGAPGAAIPAGKAVDSATLAGDDAAVRKALQGWANAWSRKDERAYLAYYAADFRPPRGMARKAWESERIRPMKKPGRLLVEVDDVKVSFDEDRASVRFRQHYSSPYLKSSVGKTIVFVKSRGRWLIQQERIA